MVQKKAAGVSYAEALEARPKAKAAPTRKPSEIVGRNKRNAWNNSEEDDRGLAKHITSLWRELTVRALLLGKVALLRTVMTHLKGFELSAEVLAETWLLILSGAEQSWIRAGIGVERDIPLEKLKKVLAKDNSNNSKWMQKCKNPSFRGLPFNDFDQVVTTLENWPRQGRDADQFVQYLQMAFTIGVVGL